jgi:hypothetical protein
MKRIASICLALLLGISAACGGGSGGPGRDICEWGTYWDPYTEQYVSYENCYDDPYYYKYEDPSTGHQIIWSSDYEGAQGVSPAQFEADYPNYERLP